MPEDDVMQLKIEFAKLQTELKNHTSSSVDFRDDIKNMLRIIQKDIAMINSGAVNRQEKCFDKAKDYTNSKVLWAISIPTAVFILVKLFDMFHQ